MARGAPTYMAIYELDSLDVLLSREWAEAGEKGRWPTRSAAVHDQPPSHRAQGDLMRFKNKVALITAGGQRHRPRHRQDHGKRRRHRDREPTTTRAISTRPCRRSRRRPANRAARCRASLCDALDPQQVEKLIAKSGRDHGGIDILVNAVGGSTVIANPQATHRATELRRLAEAHRLQPGRHLPLHPRHDPGDEEEAQRQRS